MKINSQTKISVILKHNKEAIEAIASVNPHFNKLKNPILRSILASRVTVADAARIGKCAVSDIMNKLATIGFEIEAGVQKKDEKIEENPNEKILEVIQDGKIKTLDVQPILKAGSDPFTRIMEELKQVPEGYALEVLNSFEPTPLIKILNKKGYTSYVKSEAETVYTYFLKVAEPKKQEDLDALVVTVSLAEMEKEKEKYSHKLREADVRDLEMPLPMVTILNELESLPQGYALFVHHKKVPQYLLPELAERHFKTLITEIEEGNVKLLIYK